MSLNLNVVSSLGIPGQSRTKTLHLLYFVCNVCENVPLYNSGLYNRVDKRYLQSLAIRETIRQEYLWWKHKIKKFFFFFKLHVYIYLFIYLLFSVSWVDGHQRSSVPNCSKLPPHRALT